jgi:hypothetical protein
VVDEETHTATRHLAEALVTLALSPVFDAIFQASRVKHSKLTGVPMESNVYERALHPFTWGEVRFLSCYQSQEYRPSLANRECGMVTYISHRSTFSAAYCCYSMQHSSAGLSLTRGGMS